MSKFLFAALLLISWTGAFTQDLKQVQEKISKGKYTEAKELIDKFLIDPLNKDMANAWYYKGKVYKELASNDSTGSLGFDAGKEAIDAFKKYQELDKNNQMMTLDQNVELFQLFDLYYNQGVKHYNAAEYQPAFSKMKTALDLEDYIVKKGFSYRQFSFPVIDTNLLNLTASAAYLSQNVDQAIPIWERLLNARIKEKDFRDVYGVVVGYYSKKNDHQKASRYLTIGKELFPSDTDYWISLEFDLTNPGKDTIKRFARYEQLVQKYPENYPLVMDYAIEQFNYTYARNKRPADFSSRQDKLQSTLSKAISINSTAMGNFVMSQHLFYQIIDLEDELRSVKGSAAIDMAKKKELGVRIDAKNEDFHSHALKAYDLYSVDKELRVQDKVNLKKLAGQLIDYYNKTKQPDKAAAYREKLKSL